MLVGAEDVGRTRCVCLQERTVQVITIWASSGATTSIFFTRKAGTPCRVTCSRYKNERYKAEALHETDNNAFLKPKVRLKLYFMLELNHAPTDPEHEHTPSSS